LRDSTTQYPVLSLVERFYYTLSCPPISEEILLHSISCPPIGGEILLQSIQSSIWLIDSITKHPVLLLVERFYYAVSSPLIGGEHAD